MERGSVTQGVTTSSTVNTDGKKGISKKTTVFPLSQPLMHTLPPVRLAVAASMIHLIMPEIRSRVKTNLSNRERHDDWNTLQFFFAFDAAFGLGARRCSTSFVSGVGYQAKHRHSAQGVHFAHWGCAFVCCCLDSCVCMFMFVCAYGYFCLACGCLRLRQETLQLYMLSLPRCLE